MKTWIAQAKVPDRLPIWMGPFEAEGRAEAKRAARLYVSARLPLDAKIISIAEGTIRVSITGPEIPFEEELETT